MTDLADHFNDIASIEDLYCKLKSLPINYEDIHKIDSAVVMKLNSLVSDAVNAGNTQKLRNPDLWLRFATHNDSASTCVLGRYYPDNISMCYDDIAKTNGLSYFELCCYDRLNNALGNDLMWEINEAYLDIQISKGKKFLLNCDPYDLDNLFRDGIYDNAHLRSFGKEINYLRDKGYTFKIDPQKTGFYIAEKTK